MYKPHRVHLRGQGSQGKYDELGEIREEITMEKKEKRSKYEGGTEEMRKRWRSKGKVKMDANG